MHKLNLTHSIIELYFFPKVHFTHNRTHLVYLSFWVVAKILGNEGFDHHK